MSANRWTYDRKIGIVILWRVALVAVGLSLPAAAHTQETSVRRRAIGDTVFVHSFSALFRDTATLRAVRSIGRVDGPEETLLHRVTTFVPDRGGVVVADAYGLRRFRADGSVTHLARVGQGPGEVLYPVDLAIGTRDDLHVLDPANSRISILLADGSVNGFRLSRDIPTWRVRMLALTDEGGLITEMTPQVGTDGVVRYPRRIFVELSRDGAAVDTIWADQRFGDVCPELSTPSWRSGYYEDLRAPYFPKVMWSVGPDASIAIGCPATYAFEIQYRSGEILSVSRDYKPVEVSRNEATSFVEGQTFVQRLQHGGWRWQGPRPPRVRPAYEEIILGERGRIWVRPSHRRIEVRAGDVARPDDLGDVYWVDPERSFFDVFAQDGTYLGVVELPSNLSYSPNPGGQSIRFSHDSVWAVTRDEFGVERVTQFTVEWPAR